MSKPVPATVVVATPVSLEDTEAAPPGGIMNPQVTATAVTVTTTTTTVVTVVGGNAPAHALAAAVASGQPGPAKQSRVAQQLANLQLPAVIGPRTVIPGFTWVKRPKPTFEKRCTYDACPKPLDSAHFFRIDEGRTAGNQDWSALNGMVLCEACYGQYKKRGTLERGGTKASLDPKRKRCTYEGCDKPDESSHFYLIEAGKTAGNRDWSPLVGQVLCHTCYCRWKNRGTFDRVLNRPVDPKLRSCSWKGCEKPAESKSYAKIEPGKTTGGQDWTPLVRTLHFAFFLCHPSTPKRGAIVPLPSQRSRTAPPSPARPPPSALRLSTPPLCASGWSGAVQCMLQALQGPRNPREAQSSHPRTCPHHPEEGRSPGPRRPRRRRRRRRSGGRGLSADKLKGCSIIQGQGCSIRPRRIPLQALRISRKGGRPCGPRQAG